MTSTHSIPIPGGRKIAVESYGDPQGAPVFFFHGWPSSRWQGALGDRVAAEEGIRFLAVDRPGVGHSDLHIGRRLLDMPEAITAIADHFAFREFHVAGVSGGGPYAAACAWALPDRVRAAAIISGAPPLADRTDVSTLMPVYRVLLGAYRRHPELIRRTFRMLRPVATIRPPRWMFMAMLHTLPKCDRVALADPLIMDRAWEGYHGAWINHPDGIFHDARIYADSWGFDPAEIRVPVSIWHGKEDRNFHWPLALELAARIPKCQTHILDDEGHYSLIVNRHREVLRDLMTLRDIG